MHDDEAKKLTTETAEEEETKIFIGERTPYIIIYIGNNRGKRFPLRDKPLRIGRSEDVEISIDDERISREHCVIEPGDKVVIVKDLGSTNGTFIDGSRIEQDEILYPGASLQVGRTVMKLEYKFQSEVEFEDTILQNATIDSLTEAYNRGFFMKRAEEELSMAKRTKASRCLMLIDVDYFKRINDTYGHPAGDFVLQSLAVLIEQQKRKEDILGRFGGDEFIVMLRGVEAPDGAFQFAERIRKNVEQMDIEYNESKIPVNISIGVYFEDGTDISTLPEIIEKADNALYQAKDSGRNQVHVNSEFS